MHRKSQRLADDTIDLTEAEHDRRRIPASPAPAPMATLTDPASTNVWYFDGALAYAYGHGVGSVTLTNRRQLVDTSGQVFEDTLIAGLLRAPLASLLNLRQVIDEIEKLAQRAAANAAAAAEAPSGLPH